jgi:predicted DCC family thiol-disulfide oxidoreductase YuxK
LGWGIVLNDYKLVIFDGVCNFCNWGVDFIIKRDRKDQFKFASLQSRTAKEKLESIDHQPDSDSIILIESTKSYVKSTAVLRIAKELSGVWPILYVFIALPTTLRDKLYDIIATNRYRFFGKRASCRVPTRKEKEKFLNDVDY